MRRLELCVPRSEYTYRVSHGRSIFLKLREMVQKRTKLCQIMHQYDLIGPPFMISVDPIYFVRFELSLIPLIDWNLEILHKCHNYFDLYKLLLISKIHFGSPVLNTLLFLVSLGSLLCLSCPLQSWKQQHTNLLCIVRVTHLVFSDIILK